MPCRALKFSLQRRLRRCFDIADVERDAAADEAAAPKDIITVLRLLMPSGTRPYRPDDLLDNRDLARNDAFAPSRMSRVGWPHGIFICQVPFAPIFSTLQREI